MTESAVVIGGGAAGLSAALVLARACLSVRVLDGGTPRNAISPAMHGMIGHDGITPAQFRERAREDLERYGVVFDGRRAASIERRGAELSIGLEDGTSLTTPRALLATGLLDRLPALPGLREVWGRSAFFCPHCHGWEHRGERWGVLAIQKSVARMTPSYLRWTPSITLLLNGRTDVPAETLAMLAQRAITIAPDAVASLRTEGDALRAAVFADGTELRLDALLLHPPQRQCDLVLFSGVKLDDEGMVKIDEHHRSSLSGLWAAGDCTGKSSRALAAAAHGAEAAASMIDALTR